MQFFDLFCISFPLQFLDEDWNCSIAPMIMISIYTCNLIFLLNCMNYYTRNYSLPVPVAARSKA